MTDYAMFTPAGNTAVHALVEQAWNWLLNELVALGEQAGTEEATDTAVREAAYAEFCK